jgi:signal transduction histidine kinase
MTDWTTGKNRRVLVVDDNPAIHHDIRRILVPERSSSIPLEEAEAAVFGMDLENSPAFQFEMECAHQGQDGLELVREAVLANRPFALAFIDVRMPPGWDGIETTSRIWQVDPDIQVVICTAYSDYSWGDTLQKLQQADRFLILKKPFDNVEVRQLAAALTEKWWLLRQSQNQVHELQVAVLDRTRALKEQQAQLENTHTQLLHAQKMESIGQLAAGIAHEINTPTQFIGDNLRFLQGGFQDFLVMIDKFAGSMDPAHGTQDWGEHLTAAKAMYGDLDIDFLREEIPKAISQSLDGVERVATIVRSMKEFSHPGGREKSVVDLNKAIQSTITVARNEWKYVADLLTNFDPLLPGVSCMPGDINQVVLNLIINAAHAIKDVVGDSRELKGTITVGTRLVEDHVEISVSDSGCGIPKKNLTKIFEPFFTTKEVGKGTGQGLAIAHNVVVEKHGGSIHCESEIGQGTTFRVRLPVALATADTVSA